VGENKGGTTENNIFKSPHVSQADPIPSAALEKSDASDVTF